MAVEKRVIYKYVMGIMYAVNFRKYLFLPFNEEWEIII